MTPDQLFGLGTALAQVRARDALFFERRPGRQYRIRRAFAEEIALARYRGVFTRDIPEALRLFIGKRASGPRSYVVGFMAAESETDLADEEAGAVFAVLASHGDHTLATLIAHPERALSSSYQMRGPIE